MLSDSTIHIHELIFVLEENRNSQLNSYIFSGVKDCVICLRFEPESCECFFSANLVDLQHMWESHL